MEIKINIPDKVFQDMKLGQPFTDELMKEGLEIMFIVKIAKEYQDKDISSILEWLADQNIDVKGLKYLKKVLNVVNIDKLKETV